uniref:Uncharacterized protein n=1 Tax=Chaetoceros debilis TaxID=122233 RepID=A0A7S3QBM6_9STRA
MIINCRTLQTTQVIILIAIISLHQLLPWSDPVYTYAYALSVHKMDRDSQKHLQTIRKYKYLNQSDKIAPFRIDIQRDDEEKKSSPFGAALEHQVFCVIQEILPDFLLD